MHCKMAKSALQGRKARQVTVEMSKTFDQGGESKEDRNYCYSHLVDPGVASKLWLAAPNYD